MAKKITLPYKQEWIDALVYTCPLRCGSGVFTSCVDGTCCKGKSGLCSRVSEVLKAYVKIIKGEIEVL